MSRIVDDHVSNTGSSGSKTHRQLPGLSRTTFRSSRAFHPCSGGDPHSSVHSFPSRKQQNGFRSLDGKEPFILLVHSTEQALYQIHVHVSAIKGNGTYRTFVVSHF
ncbi:hypothetical protein VTK73DRAFT_6057 [Phialemonium thermophilum]|uniref:Uncharacterized protein n=1 Tax=Phialemonium thermophilum TaxID=223376 RepID=A0ABR3XWX6_9PEZI